MGKFSLANLFGITIRESANDGSDFTNPDADYRRLFLGEDGLLHLRDSAGTVTDIGTAATDATLSTSDITTNNASTSKHGFLKKLSNVSTDFMNGQGNWATPSGGGGSIAHDSATCTADTSLSTGSYVDVTGMAITLAAGTWYFVWHVSIIPSASGHNFQRAKVYDGSTTIYDESSWEYAPISGGSNNISGNGKAVLSGSTTLKVAAQGVTGDTASRNIDGGSSNLASQIWAIQVA